MASFVSSFLLNEGANAATASTLSVRVYSTAAVDADSGRIGTVSVDHPASEWTAASGGESETTVATEYSELDAANSVTVRSYAVYRGNNRLFRADLTAAVVVAAGAPFRLRAGTVKVTYSNA